MRMFHSVLESSGAHKLKRGKHIFHIKKKADVLFRPFDSRGSLVASQESADTNLCGEAWWFQGDFFHQTMGVRSCLSAVTKERGDFHPD